MQKRVQMKLGKKDITINRIATDILWKQQGNGYILVISDYFTKWTETFPMPNMEAADVAE